MKPWWLSKRDKPYWLYRRKQVFLLNWVLTSWFPFGLPHCLTKCLKIIFPTRGCRLGNSSKSACGYVDMWVGYCTSPSSPSPALLTLCPTSWLLMVHIKGLPGLWLQMGFGLQEALPIDGWDWRKGGSEYFYSTSSCLGSFHDQTSCLVAPPSRLQISQGSISPFFPPGFSSMG